MVGGALPFGYPYAVSRKSSEPPRTQGPRPPDVTRSAHKRQLAPAEDTDRPHTRQRFEGARSVVPQMRTRGGRRVLRRRAPIAGDLSRESRPYEETHDSAHSFAPLERTQGGHQGNIRSVIRITGAA